LIATASDDLSTWAWPSLFTSLGAVSAVAARESNVCVAGELGAGIASMAPLASSPTATLSNDHRIFEPAWVAIAGRDGCIVGTARGALVLPWPGALSPDSAAARPLGLTPPVRSLASSGDTIWIGTTRGLYRVVGDSPATLVRLPASVGLDIDGLAIVSNGLAVAGSGEIWLGSGAARTEVLTRSPVSVARLGRLTALASDARTLWLGGSNGVIAVEMSSGAMRDVALDDPRSIAPPVAGGRDVRAIALTDDAAWIGTAAGIVRVRRSAEGLPR
jgi:ligand-binding sensor domain-containing protein